MIAPSRPGRPGPHDGVAGDRRPEENGHEERIRDRRYGGNGGIFAVLVCVIGRERLGSRPAAEPGKGTG